MLGHLSMDCSHSVGSEIPNSPTALFSLHIPRTLCCPARDYQSEFDVTLIYPISHQYRIILLYLQAEEALFQAVVMETMDYCNHVCLIACITYAYNFYLKFHTDTIATFNYIKQYFWNQHHVKFGLIMSPPKNIVGTNCWNSNTLKL